MKRTTFSTSMTSFVASESAAETKSAFTRAKKSEAAIKKNIAGIIGFVET